MEIVSLHTSEMELHIIQVLKNPGSIPSFELWLLQPRAYARPAGDRQWRVNSALSNLPHQDARQVHWCFHLDRMRTMTMLQFDGERGSGWSTRFVSDVIAGMQVH